VIPNINLYSTPGAAASKALWQGYNSTLAQLLDTNYGAGGVWNMRYRGLDLFNHTDMVFVSCYSHCSWHDSTLAQSVWSL
jgi:hypothetical protein